MHEKAGLFFEKLGDASRAMDSYRKGNAYARAVELSRRAFQAVIIVESSNFYLLSTSNF